VKKDMKKIRIALAGNPNVGKSTLFNAITGARQHVGNWPGVTVEKKVGRRVYKGVEIEVVDLPGTYSLTAYSLDEIVARDYIVEEKPDVVVHVVDASNLERNLYLTTQLMELGCKVVIALNMVDLAEKRGDKIHVEKMAEFLEIPVVKTIASIEYGVKTLLDEVLKEAGKGIHHEHEIGYGKEIEKLIVQLENIIRKDKKLSNVYPPRWLAVKLLENDENIKEKLKRSKIKKDLKRFLAGIDTEEIETVMVDKRYEVINAVLHQVLKRGERTQLTISDMIDRVFTNKYLGIPLFLIMMWGAFELTFTFALPFSDLIDKSFGLLADWIRENVEPAWLASLLGDGIIGGIGFVLVFVPNIFLLFFLLSILEDSGYLARAAFIMDKIMYSIGLHGKSFIPLLMGFGCNVPAIMATRTIEDEKDRLITILVNPFMSCGARLPVYLLLAGVFFGKDAATVIFFIYALGILIAVLSAKLFRLTLLPGKPAPFIMELPPYRLPTLRTSALHMWERGRLYLKKAGTIIFAATVVIWILTAFGSQGYIGEESDISESYAADIGRAFEPVTAPLGFNWKMNTALVFGFVAKEVVVSSLGVLYGSESEEETLTDSLQKDKDFSPLVSLELMVFVLVYVPCVATVAAIYKETNSFKWTLFSVVYGLVLAWLLAFLIHITGGLLG